MSDSARSISCRFSVDVPTPWVHSELMTNTTSPATETLKLAQAAVRDGETRGLSERAMAKRWKAYFAAEDAVKASVGVWR